MRPGDLDPQNERSKTHGPAANCGAAVWDLPVNTNNIMNENNTPYATDILYATNGPDQVLERLDEMASNSEDVCLRLEMLESPISVYGIIRKKYEGAYTVESSDEQSHATFTAKQVTSIGAVCIWITL